MAHKHTQLHIHTLGVAKHPVQDPMVGIVIDFLKPRRARYRLQNINRCKASQTYMSRVLTEVEGL